MFRSRVFGGAPDGFHLACEYGPANVQGKGNMPTPEALTPMELDWTSAESETQVCRTQGVVVFGDAAWDAVDAVALHPTSCCASAPPDMHIPPSTHLKRIGVS
jgi:hypothetical protein